jgi:hypothetical protein
MYYYVSEPNYLDNKSKLNYILKKKNLKYSLCDEYLNIIIKKNFQEYSIYYENEKPLYIISNIENDKN